MPHLSLPIGPGGPLFDCRVGVSVPRAEALKKVGQLVPAPVNARALIDTGASCTSIDPTVLKKLGVVSTGTTPVHTPSTKSGQPHVANQFDISIIVLHPKLSWTLTAVPIIEAELLHQGLHALIGRDILSNCLFTYDGQAKTFCLAF